jgi:hypothetical protein
VDDYGKVMTAPAMAGLPVLCSSNLPWIWPIYEEGSRPWAKKGKIDQQMKLSTITISTTKTWSFSQLQLFLASWP